MEHTLLRAVAEQLLTEGKGEIVIAGQKFDVKRVGSGRLRSVNFQTNGRELHATSKLRQAEPVGKVSQRRPSRGAVWRPEDPPLRCGFR